MRGRALLWLAASGCPLVTGGVAAQSTEVVASGDTISFGVYGSGSPTVLLVHGWSNNRTFWEPHIFTLSQRYQVVAPDLASFGESTGHRSSWTMASFASDLSAVLDRIGADRVVVVGFSMGGPVAVELAARNRDDVIGVVLVDILQDVDAAPTDQEIDAVLASYRRDYRLPASVRGALSSEASETLVRRYVSRTPATAPGEWWSSLRNTFVWIREDFRPALRKTNVPIRAINADHTPTTVTAWRRYDPSFAVHVVPGVGHLGTIWERVGEFDGVLMGFIDEIVRADQH